MSFLVPEEVTLQLGVEDRNGLGRGHSMQKKGDERFGDRICGGLGMARLQWAGSTKEASVPC